MMRGEIWWAEFGMPYGSEIGFTRPVLIVQDNAFNASGIKTIVIVPLTTNVRLRDAPGNVFVGKKESRLKNDSVIAATQLYAIDKTRLREKVSKINRETMAKVEVGIQLVLGIHP